MSAPVCPRCAGPMWTSPLLGLSSHHVSGCALGDAEDVRLVGDHDVGRARLGRPWRRTTTATERTLLLAAGADAERVRWSEADITMLSPGLRRRVFHSLGQQIVVSSLDGMPVTDTPPGAVQ